jgi:hypothetical protein
MSARLGRAVCVTRRRGAAGTQRLLVPRLHHPAVRLRPPRSGLRCRCHHRRGGGASALRGDGRGDGGHLRHPHPQSRRVFSRLPGMGAQCGLPSAAPSSLTGAGNCTTAQPEPTRFRRPAAHLSGGGGGGGACERARSRGSRGDHIGRSGQAPRGGGGGVGFGGAVRLFGRGRRLGGRGSLRSGQRDGGGGSGGGGGAAIQQPGVCEVRLAAPPHSPIRALKRSTGSLGVEEIRWRVRDGGGGGDVGDGGGGLRHGVWAGRGRGSKWMGT